MNLWLLAYIVGPVLGANSQHSSGNHTTSKHVTVELPFLTVVGVRKAGVATFDGIPFAIPPTGSNRLHPPESLQTHIGHIDGRRVPAACPQLIFNRSMTTGSGDSSASMMTNPAIKSITEVSEDCLTLNIQRPSASFSDRKLPVVVWLYGGGFEIGGSQQYHADALIERSVELSKPIIFVAPNYRLGGWGFLGGREIKMDGASNLGLLDQRLALQWVSDNIASFGGDPDAVTLWGESAGAVSVFDQMLLYGGNMTYKGRSLFRGAIMNSGSMTSTDPVDGLKAQKIYDQVTKKAGCVGPDSLQCLRQLPYEEFFKAATSVPNIQGQSSIALSYLPRPDGVVLRESPHLFATRGEFAKVPIIIGDQEDEGTIFSLVQKNLTTDQDLRQYLKSTFFPLNDPNLVDQLVDRYPDDPSTGSPYGTGSLNALYPEYKRLAAILGDFTFTLVRRVMLGLFTSAAPEVPVWSYLSSDAHDTPFVGTAHASDLLHSFGGLQDETTRLMQSYYINFINALDPNEKSSGLPAWPKWQEARQLLNFKDNGTSLIPDDFRPAAFEFLKTHSSDLMI